MLFFHPLALSKVSGRQYLALRVHGNYIGTDAAGNLDLGNRGGGVTVDGGAVGARTYPVIGGNLVSGNGDDGIRLVNVRGGICQVVANYVGTSATGAARVGNDGDGMEPAVVHARLRH